MKSQLSQKGVAIVMAMGVVALATLTVTATLVYQSSMARHNELTRDRLQALSIAVSGVDWARTVLRDDKLASSVDHLSEPWALQLPAMTIDRGNLQGSLEDQHSKFNINNIVQDGKINSLSLAHFVRLLEALNLPQELAYSALDWIDPDTDTSALGGAEDAHYRSKSPPYLSANQQLSDVGELSLVKGFTPEVIRAISPYVTALPRFTAVNVNTASPVVIYAVVDGLTLEEAQQVVAKRDVIYARNLGDFKLILPQNAQPQETSITVQSDYFIGKINVNIGLVSVSGTALIYRGDSDWPSVLWRKIL